MSAARRASTETRGRLRRLCGRYRCWKSRTGPRFALPFAAIHATFRTMARRLKLLQKAGVLGPLIAAAVGIASTISAQDFYEQRLRAGEAELSAKQAAEAAASLRIAAFGLLDRPPLLCEALAHQAIAEEASGKSVDATATLARIAQVARTYPTCRNASIEPARRAEFAALARRRLAPPDSEAILAPPASAVASGPTPAPVAAAVPPTARAPSPVAAIVPPAATAPPRPTATPAPPPVSTPRSAEAAASVGEDVDRQPQLLATTKPVYPPAALQARVGGIVLLRVLVSVNGGPARVEVARSVQPDLDSAAVAAVRQWHFEPAKKRGVAVEAWMTVAVPFDPSR